MKLFEDIDKPATLAESVAQSILQYVQREQLAPGDPLPKEEEIAAQLNVSRHIVREGISGLKTLGVIESRKRKGMFIKHRLNAFESVRKLADAHLFSEEECRQFMQIRVIMEMGMVNYIWKHRTADDIAELKRLAQNSTVSVIQYEIEFHSKLFSMGGNGIASQFQSILISAFDKHFHIPAHDVSYDIPTHLKICEILENGTLEEFRNQMEKHFEAYNTDRKTTAAGNI